jgi:hypothetical protein
MNVMLLLWKTNHEALLCLCLLDVETCVRSCVGSTGSFMLMVGIVLSSPWSAEQDA